MSQIKVAIDIIEKVLLTLPHDKRQRVLDFIIDGYSFESGMARKRPADCLEWYQRGCPNEDYDDFLKDPKIWDLRSPLIVNRQ